MQLGLDFTPSKLQVLKGKNHVYFFLHDSFQFFTEFISLIQYLILVSNRSKFVVKKMLMICINWYLQGCSWKGWLFWHDM
jgi:hypothetical protein